MGKWNGHPIISRLTQNAWACVFFGALDWCATEKYRWTGCRHGISHRMEVRLVAAHVLFDFI